MTRPFLASVLGALVASSLHACGGKTNLDPGNGTNGGGTSGKGGKGGTSSGATGAGAVSSSGGSGGALSGGGGKGASGGTFGEGGEGGDQTECDVEAVPGTRAIFNLASTANAAPNNLAFFDAPWPELSRPASALANFPNPATASGCPSGTTDATLGLLIDAIDPIEYRAYLSALAAKFQTNPPNNAAIYIRFNGALDPASFPSAGESLDPATSPIFLVNVDSASPPRGRVVPVLTRVFEESRYLPPHTLSIMPHPGFPLEPGALYAAVVLRNLGDAAGQPLGSPATFEALKEPGECAVEEYTAAFERLESDFAVPRSDVAVMSVFRAGTPTTELESVLASIDAVENPAALAAAEVDSVTQEGPSYYLVSGSFETLIYQYGTPPYLPAIDISIGPALTPVVDVSFDANSEEGRLLGGGPPVSPGGDNTTVPRTERIDFRLAIPTSVVTAAGSNPVIEDVPVVVYGPGTGGGKTSPYPDGMWTGLAGLGIATFSTDPVMRQDRAHSDNIDPELLDWLALYDLQTGAGAEAALISAVESGDLFYNPLNHQAAKGNSLQAAVDYAWQAKVLGSLSLQVTLGGIQRTVSFDPSRRFYFGHSQGASVGPLLAPSQSVSAMVLSAPAGHVPTNLLGKTKPDDTLGFGISLGYIVCDSPAEPLDAHHPFLNLLMHWFEQIDAVNYAPLLIGEAKNGPKHTFVVAGTQDHYVAPGSHDALTSAGRFHQLSPELADVPGQTLLNILAPNKGYATTYASLSGNVYGGGANFYTGAFRQYHVADASCPDDHFVYQCGATSARADLLKFFETAAQGSTPTVP